MDYRKYRAGFEEKLACAAVGAGAAGMAAWLFYQSVWGMLLFPAAYLVCVDGLPVYGAGAVPGKAL